MILMIKPHIGATLYRITETDTQYFRWETRRWEHHLYHDESLSVLTLKKLLLHYKDFLGVSYTYKNPDGPQCQKPIIQQWLIENCPKG